MLFNSYSFLLFLGVTFLLYYTPFLRKYQRQLLVFASFFFYSFEKPVLLFLLLASILINSICSYWIIHARDSYRKATLAIGLIANLSLLAFFKYAPLISSTFSAFGSSNDFHDFIAGIPLPLGISFYTFQGISLLVDCYRMHEAGTDEVIRIDSFPSHLLHTTLFISFFPHQVAGPIVKAHLFFPQIKNKSLKDIEIYAAFRTIVTGYFLKTVIADNLKDQTFWLDYPYFQYFSTTILFTLLFGFSIQIFSDFAGYTLIAIGIARLFGYELTRNFLFPYIAISFSDFWKRWHISLSSWLRDYLYIPLGGNRANLLRTCINMMIVMILGGLWHGAAWGYAIWGAFHGILLVAERLLARFIKLPESLFVTGLRILFVFVMVSFAWTLFRIHEWQHVVLFISSVKNNIHIPTDYAAIAAVLLLSLPVFVYHIMYLVRENPSGILIKKYEGILYGCMIFFIIFNAGNPGKFIYFQF
ncbi:MAG TPA: MBOAT family O-acyltransferase [Leptospiraceae bacterium]|nr:MBOAT family protein [Leptospirales bacterium]HMU83112.1 MBOAT family O-acyltransferase [Leptospiraceae bacterium]HMX57366.1 MBOAT family O-acyltransferase [Leptospiraceae bacterium]HMY46194.1 MBOAT family O-acyltransferase [Leptospiraceae bacterium]HNE24467.1 MBOAT family O-acyltransferase [Leptospiraceae bacterium]